MIKSEFEKTPSSRPQWKTQWGFLLAAMGSAVGLGNIWRFPYLTGLYGGSAFVIVYIACVLAVGIPIMLAEFLVGRKTQSNVVGAFRALRPGSPWAATGWLGILSGFVILSYYAVVGGWVLHYVLLALRNDFMGRSPGEIAGLFSLLIGNAWLQVFWHGVFMLLTIIIVSGGVREGIERGNDIMMPLLFFMLCVLLVYALQTTGARAGWDFLFRPRWEQMAPIGVLDALGQAFFSLSLGMGAMITYGSYLGRDVHLVRSAVVVAAGDTLVAILAAVVIFPLAFTFQLEPAAGPGLVFQILPSALSQLPAGWLLAIIFFLLLTFAALTSSISLLEVIVAYFVDERGWSRRQASWIMGGIIFGCGVPSAIQEEFLGFMDRLATNYLLPSGALLIAVFTGWVLKRSDRQPEFQRGDIGVLAYLGWAFLLCFVSPVAVILIFLRQLGLF